MLRVWPPASGVPAGGVAGYCAGAVKMTVHKQAQWHWQQSRAQQITEAKLYSMYPPLLPSHPPTPGLKSEWCHQPLKMWKWESVEEVEGAELQWGPCMTRTMLLLLLVFSHFRTMSKWEKFTPLTINMFWARKKKKTDNLDLDTMTLAKENRTHFKKIIKTYFFLFFLKKKKKYLNEHNLYFLISL